METGYPINEEAKIVISALLGNNNDYNDDLSQFMDTELQAEQVVHNARPFSPVTETKYDTDDGDHISISSIN